MSPHAFTEDQLVEQPAVGLFAELGWETVSASEEVFGADRRSPSQPVRHPGPQHARGLAEALAAKFGESGHKNTDLEVLKAAVRAKLESLIRLNQTRADFQEKFEELIEAYNNGSKNIEELFEELLKLSQSLSEEQQRHVREAMNEEELVIFDILTRPAPELSTEERAEVKKVARDLLARLKLLLVLNWRGKSSARSQLKLAIQDVLDGGLPRAYDKPLYEQKCTAIFEHVYESYPERDSGVYATPVSG